MAGLAADKSKGGQYLPSGSRPQRNLSRRVSFNESTLKHSPQSSVLSLQSSVQDIEGQRKNPPPRTSGCNICCACTSIIVGTLMLIILVVGAICFSFFQSNMPEFHFQSLIVSKLDIFPTPNSDTSFLTANIEVGLNATNKNGVMPVYYTSIMADLSSQDIYLGRVHLPELEQEPHNSTDLKLQTELNNVTVAYADAKELKKRSLNHQMLIDVILGGNVHYVINGHRMPGFPFKVLCHNIYQGELDDGEVPKCDVKMTPIS